VGKEEIETDDIPVFLAESHGKYLMDSNTTMYKVIQNMLALTWQFPCMHLNIIVDNI
jgi:hypothetical protein